MLPHKCQALLDADELNAYRSCVQVGYSCQIRISAQAPYGVAVANSVWSATFAQYLNEQLGVTLGCTFVFNPLPAVDDAYTVLAQNQTDFLLVGSGLMHCLQVIIEN